MDTWVRTTVLIAAAAPLGWLAARVSRIWAGGEGPRAPVIIAATITAFAWAGVEGPPGWLGLASLALAWTLICLAVIDLAVFRLPDVFTLPLLAAGLAMSMALPDHPALDHLAGAALGWGALAIVAFAYRRVRGVEGVGLGDAKLLAAAGAWLGWRALPSVLLIACAVAFIGVGLAALRHDRAALGRSSLGRAALDARIAFGPPLCLALWVVWLHGPLAVG